MKNFRVGDLTVFQSVFCFMKSNMYLISESEKALIIDPHFSEDTANLLKAEGTKEITVVLTHEHPDHTSGVPWLSKHFKVDLICQECCAELISHEKNNRPLLIAFVLAQQDKINGTHEAEKVSGYFEPYACYADQTFSNEMTLIWHNHTLDFKYTPGHSAGSSCVILDEKIIFTGDSFIKDLPTITRFPGGNESAFNNIAIPFLESLNPNLIVFAGHGKLVTVNDLKKQYVYY